MKSKKTQILQAIETYNGLPPGVNRGRAYNQLRQLCLNNPAVVADLVIDEDLVCYEDRISLLVEWSQDYDLGNSCAPSDNPRWAKMMRTYILPKVDNLPDDFKLLVKWYQTTHGL